MGKKIMLDAGHGLTTGGKQTCNGSAGIVKEWTMSNNVCNYIKDILADYDVEVSRIDDPTGKRDVPLIERTNKVNQVHPNVLISIHHNASTGVWNNATGVEVYYHPHKHKEADLARKLADEMSKQTGLRNRGAKSENFHMIREPKATIPSVLCEGGFMDSTVDYPVITSEKGQRAYAQAVANVCISYLQLQKKSTGTSVSYSVNTPILGKADITVDKAKAWAKANGGTDTFISLADRYWNLAPSRGGVNPAIAYVQSALETGYGRYGGVVPVTHMNPHGTKTNAGTEDKNPAHHQKFASWDEGVTAHLDKLALYAGAAGYPRAGTPDPRHFTWLKGEGTTIAKMAARYCPGNPNYASTVVSLLNKIK